MQKRFFVALLPPLAIQDYVNEIKRDFAERFDSRAAQRSPPHITLLPPFEWDLEALPSLQQALEEFALTQVAIAMTLDGFAAFPPRVIFIDVHKTPPLLELQQHLVAQVEARLGIVGAHGDRPFTPHLTVAFRDLSRTNFDRAWQEYRDRPVQFEFTADQLTLLIHSDRRWITHQEFPMQKA